MSKPRLTIGHLKRRAAAFAAELTANPIADLFGVTDGKAVGSYVEHRFRALLQENYEVEIGNTARGIDFPRLRVDLKVTSSRQPQSSSPFRDAAQKIYGLGHSLLVFVYEKSDDISRRVANLVIRHVIFVSEQYTSDYQTTAGIRSIIDQGGNEEDLDAFFQERNLPLDDIGRRNLANRVLKQAPEIGVLTISNALQSRLQYARAIDTAEHGTVNGAEERR
ncbi:restriction endonuclease [Candidatus Poriferisodalis sp.]|uniref:restriction endonuclease n=1 Tax=Candidatus Poriferisodalis sp. TaxID=3101277 RepID=UPI003B0257D4